MSDSKAEKTNESSVSGSKMKLNDYYEILKIKPKKQESRSQIDKLKTMLTKQQYEKLNIPNE